ncbi:tRNA lysidine(34) synthetase TilS [Actomonas aquatica]|uniref:tRNA(Ile)-lysidine synthase n=1 Tax=Actomonas aquatica TaxID=2866162 RepID=A0ABZ1CAG2_9BACT|nr:tRNA lysidine(34) synthetase TilS [Opitutus sp. WL0086]WRQ88630.1 tRNA lysidine(34) synthetase TilS [Opitutus sp. WL0086]
MPGSRTPSWPEVAAALAERLPVNSLDAAVRAFVAPGQPAGRGRWVLACSGGADSVALVLTVGAHWPRKRDQLVLAHFDHRLRGRASTADARFCARLADGLGLRFESARWEARPTRPSEAQARAARQTFLAEVCRRHRARVIWTGHQQDDIAETLLMRLARGSGTEGLAAPRPVQMGADGRWRLRPLLGWSRTALREELQAAGGRWREDESNAADTFLRNRMRADVLPAWAAAAGERDVVAGAALSRARLEEDAVALDAWVDELAPIDDEGVLCLERLGGKPVAVWRRALHRWLALQDDPGDLSRAGFEDLLAKAMAGRTQRFSLGRGGFVRIRRGKLYFQKLSA